MINNDTPLSPEATIKECTLINDQIWRELNSAYGITKDTQADCVDWFSNLYDAACVFKLQSCKVIDQLKIAKEALEECGEFRKQINPFHEIDDETLDKLTKISDIVDVALSKLTI